MEDFRTRLDVSKPYQMCDINKRVLKPIAKELKKDEKLNAQSLIFDVEKHTHSKRQMEMSSINKSKQIRSREKTPRWLTDLINLKIQLILNLKKIERGIFKTN